MLKKVASSASAITKQEALSTKEPQQYRGQCNKMAQEQS